MLELVVHKMHGPGFLVLLHAYQPDENIRTQALVLRVEYGATQNVSDEPQSHIYPTFRKIAMFKSLSSHR